MKSRAHYILKNVQNRLGHSLKNPRFFLHYLRKLSQYSGLDTAEGLLVSYPKSGRTWLQKIVVEAWRISAEYENEVADISGLSSVIPSFPLIIPTHAGGCWEENFNVLNGAEITQLDYKDMEGKKMVYMYRDPRDVLVSQYYHMKHRTRIKSISKQELLHSPYVGADKLIAYMNRWVKMKKSNGENIHMVSYEELHDSTLETMKAVMGFWSISCENDILMQAINNTSIDKMRAQESADAKTPWTYTPDGSLSDSYHARKGKTGEYLTFFNEEEQKFLGDKMEENLDGYFSAYLRKR